MSEPPATPSDPSVAPSPAGGSAPVAPADRLPLPSLRERAAWYAGAMVVCALLITGGMQLWNRDLKAPFYYDNDGLLYLPLIRAVVEQGFWNCWHTDRLGAPYGQELHDFPVIDFLHFAIFWALGKVFSDVLMVYNAYTLLAYPLTTLTAMWVFRWLKLSLPAAAVGGILYALIPHHQERYQFHTFLAFYWWVPVSMVPAFAICMGNFPFFRRCPDGAYPPLDYDRAALWADLKGAARGSKASWRALLGYGWRAAKFGLRALFTRSAFGHILLGAVTASSGAYYAFFACACYAFAGLYGWLIHRTWRAMASAALVVAPVFTVGVLYHVPTVLYQAKFGSNPITNRYPYEADLYGLKLIHLLLPCNDHNFTPFATLRKLYAAPERPAETEAAGAFGFIGAFGLLALLGMAFLPRKRQWPEGTLAALTLFLVLLGTIGAFGAVFNQLVTPQIRAYNRLSVFIAVPCLFVMMWWLDLFLLSRTSKQMRRGRYAAFAAVLLFGYFDQTPWGWNPFNPRVMEKTDLHAERFRSDKRYFARIEATMAPGAHIFCLPHSPFPEHPPTYKMNVYEHARAYLLTDTLRWSYGAIKGREADEWARSVAFARPDELLPRLVARGFDGLLVDGRGFAPSKDGDRAVRLINRANELYRQLSGVPHTERLPEIAHEDGKQFFIDLRPYREAYRRTDPAGYERRVTAEAEWIAPLWLNGFFTPGPFDESGDTIRWGRFDSDLVLVNPANRTRTVEISFTIGVEVVGPFDVTIGVRGQPPLEEPFQLDKVFVADDPQDQKRHGISKTYRVQLAPGRNVVHFRCRPPVYFLPFDRKNLCYFIKDFQLIER